MYISSNFITSNFIKNDMTMKQPIFIGSDMLWKIVNMRGWTGGTGVRGCRVRNRGWRVGNRGWRGREAGVEGAGSGDRGGGESRKIGAGN